MYYHADLCLISWTHKFSTQQKLQFTVSSVLVQRELHSPEPVTYKMVLITKDLCFSSPLVILFLFCISVLHVPYNSAPHFLYSSQIQPHFSNLFYSWLQHILTAEKLSSIALAWCPLSLLTLQWVEKEQTGLSR